MGGAHFKTRLEARLFCAKRQGEKKKRTRLIAYRCSGHWGLPILVHEEMSNTSVLLVKVVRGRQSGHKRVPRVLVLEARH